jgi:NAD(P)-dependent dehydrogenase (short-subunit alcohol dehydrogenase family)
MTTNKCLVIGGTSGIGQTTSVLIAERMKCEIDTPTKDELDVMYVLDVESYIHAHGPYSHIVYSAGLNGLHWIKDSDICAITHNLLAVNCTGFISTISEHIRLFPEAPISAVAVSSDAARIPMRGSVAYCTSKAALNMAVKTMARELAPRHRINAVAPGMVEDTPMTKYIDETLPGFRNWSESFARKYEKRNTPTGRRATKQEVAETIFWVLIGPPQMTGAIIEINGGK